MATASDPFLLDAEGLRALASDRIVRRGVAYFKEERVFDLGWDDGRVWAAVDGSARQPYSVDLALDEDGELLVDCDCPFDTEPACKHAVAVLLAYAARQDVDDTQIRSAADEAVAERRKRAKSEVEVEHVGGDIAFGTWRAWSLWSSGVARRRTYTVELRSVLERINHCTCPDFASNRLGTCKHIEAVIHEVKKRSEGRRGRSARALSAAPAVNVVYLAWDVADAPRVRLRRAAAVAQDVEPVLHSHFESAGFLRREPLDALERFQERVADRDDVHVSPDALAYVRRQARALTDAARAGRIRDEIRRSGGQIDGVHARLYPYQVDGVAFLAAAGRALLADDMGLGKTLQAIAAAAWLGRNEGVRRTLVVCPASLKHQWKREIERFADAEAVVVHGPARERAAQYRAHAPFTIVNYELAIRDVSVIPEALAPDLLILDEAQRIKNWRTKTADAIKSIESRYAFVLTGTPLENRLEDLYSLLQVVDRDVLGPLWHFLLEFHVTDSRGKVLGYRNLSELRRRLAPFLFRRDRRLVRDQLPDRVEERLDVELTPKQRDLHDDAIAAASTIARRMKKRPLTPSEQKQLMALLQTARMACDAAGLVDEEVKGSPKLDELRRLLEELCVEGGRKAVVFSQWERMTEMAEQVARKLGLGTVRLHGGVPTARRGALLDRFREDPATQVFLSTDAGGVGLNLQTASVLVNLDLPWNPAVLDQRIARVHRLGQTESTLIVLLVAKDSYEERVGAILAGKKHLFRHVVTEDASEDVVGVSRKSLEVALEALGESAAPPEAEAEAAADAVGEDSAEEATPSATPAVAIPAVAIPPANRGAAAGAAADDPAVATAVAALQERFGARVQRVVAAGGGLLAILDAVDAADHAAAAALAAGCPVAVLDAAGFDALRRLGVAGVADATPTWEPTEPEAPRENPLEALARRKLYAAELLLTRGAPEEAVALLATAMVAAAARAHGARLMPTGDLPVWLYGEVVPTGALDADSAAQILRADALARASAVPPALADQVLRDARALVLRA